MAASAITANIVERGSSIWDRLSSHYKSHVDKGPPISSNTALLCALLYTLIYIAPFYLSSTLRSTPVQSRDAPTVIRARVRAVGLTCLLCTAITVYVLTIHGHASPQETLRLLGVWPINLLDILKVLALVTILFIGPLYESIIVDSDWRDWSFSTLKEGLWDNWTGYRNLMIAPSSEELVFRSLTISLYLTVDVPATRIVFTTPLIFGLAHVHHLVEFLQSRTPSGRRLPPLPVWINGILRSLFQFTYTSLFGFFAAFVYLRTGSLWATILAHSFCNWMGVPRLYGRVGRFAHFAVPHHHTTPDVAQGKRDEDTVRVGTGVMHSDAEGVAASVVPLQGPQDLGVGWTVVYYLLILGGAYGFYALLFPLTESVNAFAEF